MKLKITKEVARPKGHWQVMKWNLLKGESEDSAEVTNKDNLITDRMVSELMTNALKSAGSFGTRMYLQLSNEIPTVEDTQFTSLADTVQGGTTDTEYFFPTGAAGSYVGKEVKGVFIAGMNTSHIMMWLHLDVPLLIEEGDVLKVSYVLNPLTLGTITTSGTIPYKTYAYGEDPEDPNAGTLVENIDYTASYIFGQSTGIRFSQYAPVKNPDGSMSYGEDLKFINEVEVRPITSPATPISSVSCSVIVDPQFNRRRSLSVTFPNTKPVQEPGSYIEVEIDFNVRVLPHV